MSSAVATDESTSMHAKLGLGSAVAIVSGVMIGSGIFIVSADIARQLGSPCWLLAVWLFTAVLTWFGALSYGKLASAYPFAGGQYIFLKQAWGEIPAFLYGWALFFIIQTGTVAAVAVAFAKFLGVLCPWVSSQNILLPVTAGWGISSQQAIAIGVIAFLTALNCRGVRHGAVLQNTFTILKTLGVLLIIACGAYALMGLTPQAAKAVWFLQPKVVPDTLQNIPFWSAFAVATVGAIFSADSWNNVTFIGSEVKNPQVNLARAMSLGTLAVLALYLLTNVAYVYLLPFTGIQYAAEDRVATAALIPLLGQQGNIVMATIILISTFGCLNGLILAGARVFYAMAKDALFFPAFSRLSPQTGVPIVSLIGQGVCAELLTLSGSYGQLLDYIVFTTLLFYMMTVLGLFKLARQDAVLFQMTSWRHYIVPLIYLFTLTYVAFNLLVYKTATALPGLGIILVGLPIYAIWKARYPAQPVSVESER